MDTPLAKPARAFRLVLFGIGTVAAAVSTPVFGQGFSVAVEHSMKVVGNDGKSQLIEIDEDAHANLAAGPSELKVTSVPLVGGRTEDFVLERFEVFSPNAELVAFDGKTSRPISRPDIVYYRGRGVKDPSETAFFSVDKTWQGEVRMMSMHPERGMSVLAPGKDKLGRTVHKLAPGDAEGLESFACHADSLELNQKKVANFVEPDTSGTSTEVAASTTMLEAEIIVDMTNHLFTSKFGSNQNTAMAYLGNVMAASSAIYQRDLNVTLTVKQATIWTSADPFDGGSSDVQLTNYMNWNKTNRANVSRDAAHLMAGRVSYGGIAFVGGLCMSNYGYGVSNLYGTYTYPTSSYTWDVNVVAHEIGHNFSSPHTHCYSPPIDRCYSGGGSCYTGTRVPEAGTIMSYCHLTNGAGSVGLYFHPRCVETMRAYAENQTCLTATSAGAPSAAGYGSTGKQIGNGDWTPSEAEGTRYGKVAVGGDQPRTMWFSLWNSGTAPLYLNSGTPVTITGTNPTDFWVAQQPSTVIQPNSGAWFAVAFNPQALGTRSAMVHIPTNDPSNTVFSFWVDGTGVTTPQYWYQFSGARSIPDNNATGVNVPINVTDFPGLLADVDVRFDGANCSSANGASGVGLTHSFVGDLIITLRSPSGTVITLMSRSGSNGRNLCQTTFDNMGGGPSISSITPSAAPWPGSYIPVNSLGAFNGQNPNGTWTMNVRDAAAGNTGIVRAVTLLLTPRDGLGETFTASTNGWVASGGSNGNMSWTQLDTQRQELKVWMKGGVSQPRYLGWYSSNPNSQLPYSVVGPDRYVRAKFHVYAGGQATSDRNRIPNLRMRVSNRFAYSSVLDVQHHSNSDPEGSAFGGDLRPSKDPSRPSVYRVDFDPLDVPYLKANGRTEGIMRMFEAYATEPQEDGYLALTESSLQVYPKLPDHAQPIKVYATERNDFAGTYLSLFNINTPLTHPMSVQRAGTDLPRAWVDQYGVYLDTLNVPMWKIGIAAADFLPGAASEDHNPARRVRIEENKLYKIHFHARSVVPVNQQPHIRFRARTAKFAWTQRLEVGGAWAIGTDASTGNAAIAQQALPGLGNQHPEKINAGDTGGWYTMLFHSPLSRDIRADYGNVPLTTSMPTLANQDGPGVNTGRTRRDLLLGADIIDTISPGPSAWYEKGQVTIDRIEIRAYDRGAD